MKRLLIAILSVLYLAAATGAALRFHYCMGEVAGWSILKAGMEEPCGRCGMEKKPEGDNGCCKDEHKLVKLEVDQKANTVSPLSFPVALVIPKTSYPQESFAASLLSDALLPFSHGPPISKHIPVHLLHCTFRI